MFVLQLHLLRVRSGVRSQPIRRPQHRLSTHEFRRRAENTDAGSEVRPAAALNPLSFDADKYRSHLAGIDITEEEAAELLRTLWKLMSSFVDLGLDVRSMPKIFPVLAEDPSGKAADTLEVEELARAFNEASGPAEHATPAKENMP